MENRDRHRVCFRLSGDRLIPQVVSVTLGIQPSLAYTKGERHIGRVSKKEWKRHTGAWHLESTLNQLKSFEEHFGWLLDQLEPKHDIVHKLIDTYDLTADFFCGMTLMEGQGGPTLTPRTLARLGRFGVLIGFNIVMAKWPELVDDEEERTTA